MTKEEMEKTVQECIKVASDNYKKSDMYTINNMCITYLKGGNNA